jgi:hypothetical protein
VKHVLLGALSPMLQSIVSDTLSTRDDVVLVKSDPADPTRPEVDVVLAAAADPESPENLERLLESLWRWPRSRVIVVTSAGRDAVLYELVPRRVALGHLSPATLIDAICGERR